MPDPLDSWLPNDPLEFTRVFEPRVIDPDIAHLDRYHPVDSEQAPCYFRLKKDETNPTVAIVEVLNPENWAPVFVDVLKLLRLKVVNAGQADEHLLDDTIQGELFPMDEWKVISWTIKRTSFNGHLDPPEPVRLTDRIVWKRMDGTGNLAVSSYTWLPYRS